MAEGEAKCGWESIGEVCGCQFVVNEGGGAEKSCEEGAAVVQGKAGFVRGKLFVPLITLGALFVEVLVVGVKPVRVEAAPFIRC